MNSSDYFKSAMVLFLFAMFCIISLGKTLSHTGIALLYLYLLLGHLTLMMCSFLKKCLCQTLAVVPFYVKAKLGLLYLNLCTLFLTKH